MDELSERLNDLQFMLENPRLYLTNFFEDIRNQIDQETNELILNNEKKTTLNDADQKNKLDKLNSNVLDWTLLIIEKVKEKESQSLSMITPDFKFSSNLQAKVEKTIQSYKTILSEKKELKDLEASILRNTVELQKILFNNESIVVLSKTILESIQKSYIGDTDYFENEFFKHSYSTIIIKDCIVGKKAVECLK